MGKLRLNISMSLDGFVASPDQSEADPLGVGGKQLHQWLLPAHPVRTSRESGRGREQGETGCVALLQPST
jgi:hypothetical protein